MEIRKKLKIGIVGCGAIGSTVAEMAVRSFGSKLSVVALTDLSGDKARSLQARIRGSRVGSIDETIAASDVVVEAAHASSSFDIAKRCLAAGKSVLIMSIGGVLGREKALYALARQKGARIFFPSGAICGLDGVRALTLAGIDSLTLTTSKPPRALGLENLKKPRTVFRGTARQAVRAYPQNINVVALLSLAAEGQVAPRVRIIAVPGLTKNVHEIDVASRAAKLHIRCENTASPRNPKTSYLAILSALRSLAGISDAVRFGN